MLAVLEGTESVFIPPQVDTHPEILLNDVLKFLAQTYAGVFVHGEFDPTETPTPIKELLDSPEGLPRLDYIETTNDKLKILQVFDLPFTYYLGPKKLLSELVEGCTGAETDFGAACAVLEVGCRPLTDPVGDVRGFGGIHRKGDTSLTRSAPPRTSAFVVAPPVASVFLGGLV